MRYSYTLIKEYFDGEIRKEELLEYLDILGLNPMIISETEKDVIFELETPANRGDLLSLTGIVREILPFTSCFFISPEIDFKEEIEEIIPVEIENLNDCPYYSCRVVKNVKTNISPPDLIKKLEKLGFRSTLNTVDISNFVMAEIGQPLHIFDLDKIEGKIIVRRGKKGEKLITIDGIEREIDENILVIADERKPVAIAGIMGGKNTEVDENTENILIESALFNPVVIRRGSKKTGLITEASLRFEKGVSIETVKKGMERTTSLILQICGGKSGRLSSKGNEEIEEIEIKLSPEKVSRILGINVENEFIEKLFEKLNFSLRKEKEYFYIKIPDYRKDIKEEIDLIEEVAKYKKYSEIPEKLPFSEIKPTPSDRDTLKIEKIKDILVKEGYSEIITLTLISEDTVKNFELEETVKIENPLSSNFGFLRPSLIPSLFEIINFNISHQVKKFKVFEIGKVFSHQNGKIEENYNIVVATVNSGDFFNLKGEIGFLFEKCNLNNLKFVSDDFKFSENNGNLAIYLKEKKIGDIFIPSRKLKEIYDVEKEEIYVGEIYLEKILETISFEKTFKELPRFPSSRRDFSFIFPLDLNWRKVENTIFSLNLPVEKIEVFDIYKGKNIPEGKISISFSIIFRHKERTLESFEIENFSEKIIGILKNKFGGVLRGEISDN